MFVGICVFTHVSSFTLTTFTVSVLDENIKPCDGNNCEGDNVPDCCGRLGYGDGDCDFDTDCVGELVCGRRNCGDFRDSNDWKSVSYTGWDTTDDCCTMCMYLCMHVCLYVIMYVFTHMYMHACTATATTSVPASASAGSTSSFLNHLLPHTTCLCTHPPTIIATHCV